MTVTVIVDVVRDTTTTTTIIIITTTTTTTTTTIVITTTTTTTTTTIIITIIITTTTTTTRRASIGTSDAYVGVVIRDCLGSWINIGQLDRPLDFDATHNCSSISTP